jgi:hypothetical protein
MAVIFEEPATFTTVGLLVRFSTALNLKVDILISLGHKKTIKMDKKQVYFYFSPKKLPYRTKK